MFARVAMYHGATPDGIDELIANIGGRIEAEFDSPPGGLEGMQELMIFVDRDSGRGLAITLFASEEEMRAGDRTLQSLMSMSQAGGVRTGIEFYEVALRRARR